MSLCVCVCLQSAAYLTLTASKHQSSTKARQADRSEQETGSWLDLLRVQQLEQQPEGQECDLQIPFPVVSSAYKQTRMTNWKLESGYSYCCSSLRGSLLPQEVMLRRCQPPATDLLTKRVCPESRTTSHDLMDCLLRADIRTCLCAASL